MFLHTGIILRGFSKYNGLSVLGQVSVKRFFMTRRPTLLFLCLFLFPLSLVSGTGCGELAAIVPGNAADPIDPNFNFDSDGRKIAGGCNLDALSECYQYANEEGYGPDGPIWLEDNCNADHLNGDWIPRGCPAGSEYGYCERHYTTNYWARHYYYIGHVDNYTGITNQCALDGGTWVDP